MSYYHWRCECGAHGYSNDMAANFVVIDLHQKDGHTVTSWLRGWRKHAQVFEPVQEPPQ